MANDYGRLPKADPDELDPELRHRLEVWYDKAYPDDNLFLIRLAARNQCVH